VGTFKNFPKDYGPGTYVTLTDDRDYKNYTVVKIGGYWVMAQNLNYQKGLSHQPESKDPSTVTGSNPALIGHFWCPGGFYTGARTSTLASCDVWGALYSWETAMSFNGLGCWSTDANVTYCTGAANTDYCKMNWGRSAAESGSDGRGICPENWHVPTDFEWGVIFDGMESPVGTSHQTAVGDTDYGTLAGRRARAKCYVADETEYTDSPYLSDTQANWYYKAGYVGTDEYGFRALPAGSRQNNGSYFVFRGAQSALWSSTAHSAKDAYAREFGHHTNGVWRGSSERSTGRSVRCMRDS
jgi:uncharacterized protein (TIGR02145 family)